jgi:hypothetical protein
MEKHTSAKVIGRRRLKPPIKTYYKRPLFSLQGYKCMCVCGKKTRRVGWTSGGEKHRRDDITSKKKKVYVCLFSVPLTFCVSILWPLMCWSPKQYYIVYSIIHTLKLAHTHTQHTLQWLKGDDSSPVSTPLHNPRCTAYRNERTNERRLIFVSFMLSPRRIAALFRPLSKTLDQWRRNPCY